MDQEQANQFFQQQLQLNRIKSSEPKSEFQEIPKYQKIKNVVYPKCTLQQIQKFRDEIAQQSMSKNDHFDVSKNLMEIKWKQGQEDKGIDSQKQGIWKEEATEGFSRARSLRLEIGQIIYNSFQKEPTIQAKLKYFEHISDIQENYFAIFLLILSELFQLRNTSSYTHTQIYYQCKDKIKQFADLYYKHRDVFIRYQAYSYSVFSGAIQKNSESLFLNIFNKKELEQFMDNYFQKYQKQIDDFQNLSKLYNDLFTRLENISKNPFIKISDIDLETLYTITTDVETDITRKIIMISNALLSMQDFPSKLEKIIEARIKLANNFQQQMLNKLASFDQNFRVDFGESIFKQYLQSFNITQALNEEILKKMVSSDPKFDSQNIQEAKVLNLQGQIIPPQSIATLFDKCCIDNNVVSSYAQILVKQFNKTHIQQQVFLIDSIQLIQFLQLYTIQEMNKPIKQPPNIVELFDKIIQTQLKLGKEQISFIDKFIVVVNCQDIDKINYHPNAPVSCQQYCAFILPNPVSRNVENAGNHSNARIIEILDIQNILHFQSIKLFVENLVENFHQALFNISANRSLIKLITLKNDQLDIKQIEINNGIILIAALQSYIFPNKFSVVENANQTSIINLRRHIYETLVTQGKLLFYMLGTVAQQDQEKSNSKFNKLKNEYEQIVKPQ